jgi:hypothetical protein
MVYVYSRYIESGREDCAGIYDNWQDAIARVTALYNMDAKSAVSRGRYYYFIKEH